MTLNHYTAVVSQLLLFTVNGEVEISMQVILILNRTHDLIRIIVSTVALQNTYFALEHNTCTIYS